MAALARWPLGQCLQCKRIFKPVAQRRYASASMMYRSVADASTLQEALHIAKGDHKPVYVTTPIYYVNAAPHIGHLYSALLADALVRWYQLLGSKTVFSTGTDEHGLKIQQAAATANITPQQLCDNVSGKFKAMFDLANIGYSRFIRTTDSDHKDAVVHLWNELQSREKIYMGEHSGWYSVSDEAFLMPQDVEDVQGPNGESYKISSESRHRVEWVVEKNYKFRLSECENALKEWTAAGSVTPKLRQNHVESLFDEGLQDLSVSRVRERLQWGIGVPNDSDHTIYVWLDALTNYLTCTGYPHNSGPKSLNSWPADYHIVGKDILKFHAIYWPAFLMSASLPPPRRVVAHGHWTVDKVKMSKSLGNVVDPNDRMNVYGVDPFRYFLLKEGRLADDGDYSDARAKDTVNADLADTIGNLLSRCTSLAMNPDQCYPPAANAIGVEDETLLNQAYALPEIVHQNFCAVQFGPGILSIMAVLYETNRYFNANEPWALRKRGDVERLNAVLRTTMEVLRIAGILLQPIIPDSAERFLDRLNIPNHQRNLHFANHQHGMPGGSILGGTTTPLFQRIK